MATHVRRLRSIRRRMSFAAFDRLPRQLGWKYEYDDGYARVWPAGVFVPFEVALTAAAPDENPAIRQVTADDVPALRPAFSEAFRSAPEYADRTDAQYAAEAETYFQEYFVAVRGTPLPASCLAIQNQQVVGAALLVQNEKGAVLDCLFVCPAFSRGGWATALVRHAAAILWRSGVTRLRSYAMQANVPSMRWHERFGFRELPRMSVARHRFRYYRDEWERHQRRSDLSDDELAKIRAAMDYWDRESDRLREECFQEYRKNTTPAESTR
jgi:ribosomal protein S18 acetylase RimI-like enzyme